MRPPKPSFLSGEKYNPPTLSFDGPNLFFVFTLLCNVISSRDFGVLVSTKFLEDGSIKSAFNSVEDPKVFCSSPCFSFLFFFSK